MSGASVASSGRRLTAGRRTRAIRFPRLTHWRTREQRNRGRSHACRPGQTSRSRPDDDPSCGGAASGPCYDIVRRTATVVVGASEPRPLGAVGGSHEESRPVSDCQSIRCQSRQTHSRGRRRLGADDPRLPLPGPFRSSQAGVNLPGGSPRDPRRLCAATGRNQRPLKHPPRTAAAPSSTPSKEALLAPARSALRRKKQVAHRPDGLAPIPEFTVATDASISRQH